MLEQEEEGKGKKKTTLNWGDKRNKTRISVLEMKAVSQASKAKVIKNRIWNT